MCVHYHNLVIHLPCIFNAGHSIIKENVECNSRDEDLGKFDNVAGCANACAKKYVDVTLVVRCLSPVVQCLIKFVFDTVTNSSVFCSMQAHL